jgi:hypothetical protein
MAVVLAGCASSQVGQPTAAAPVSPTYQVPTNSAGAISLPPRPHDVVLTGVKPCALLTSAERTTLAVAAGVPGPPVQLANNSPTCNFRFTDDTPGAEYTIAVDTVEGIQLYLDPSLADNIRQVTVGDFPALDITLRPPDLLQGCTTAVSTANGQMLVVNLGQPAPGSTTAQSCARTEVVAGAALSTAQTLK